MACLPNGFLLSIVNSVVTEDADRDIVELIGFQLAAEKEAYLASAFSPC
jgi:hypothetical protein